jgi:SAM-dependent methyltransferase
MHPVSSITTDVPELSVVILCYREEEYVPMILAAVEAEVRQLGVSYELILVANYVAGSGDRSPGIAEELAQRNGRVRVVARPKEGMMGWDMRTGLEAARGRVLAVIDGDGQVPSGDVVRVYRALREGRLDLCQTHRVKREDGWSRTVLSRCYNQVFRLLFPGMPLHDVNAKPKIFTREAYRAMRLTSDDWFIDAEMILQARRRGLRVGEIPSRFERGRGRPSFINAKTVMEFLRNLAAARLREVPRQVAAADAFDAYAADYETLLARSVRWSGEGAGYFAQYKLSRIQALLQGRSPTHILDLGCGVGLLTALLGRAFPGSRVTGVDLSSSSVAEAAARCRELPNVRCALLAEGRLPEDVAGVDVAVLANVLHHIAPNDRDRFVREVVRQALRPGASVVVIEHNPLNPLSRLVVNACPFDRDARLLGRHSSAALLRRAGLRVLRKEYIVFFPKVLGALRRFERHLGWLPLGAQYLVIGETPS